MATITSKFTDAVLSKKQLVLDGAFATELESYGCNLNDPLWSAKVLFEQPDLVKKVHNSYLAAGADIIESSGYQATVVGFQDKGFSHCEAIELVKISVRTAIAARDEFVAASGHKTNSVESNNSDSNCTDPNGTDSNSAIDVLDNGQLATPIVAASVGPYGAFLADGSEYRGDYNVGDNVLVDFHKGRIALFAEEQPDVFACETVPSLQEARALAEVLSDELVSRNIPAWISFSCADEEHTCGGDLIEDCAEFLDTVDAVQAIGVNCTQPKYVESLIRHIKAKTNKAIVVYPNTGELYDDVNKTWFGEADAFDQYTKTWAEAGAQIIGGCCRTGLKNIGRIAEWAHK